MPTTTDSAQEARLRRLARRQGTLRKSRCRTPEAIVYGQYWVIDADRNLDRRRRAVRLDGR